MTFYFVMVNAWSLAASILGGTFEEDYPVMNKKEIEYDGLDYESDYMSDIDEMYSHHLNKELGIEPMAPHFFKYHE